MKQSNQNQKPRAENPQLEGLLDIALAPQSVPGGIPQDLTRKILAKTIPQLNANSSPVLAMIGPTAINAIAAVMMLAATLGLFLALHQAPNNSYFLVQLEQNLSEIIDIESTTDDLDHQIGLLAVQINDFENHNGSSGSAQLLEGELLDYELQFNTGTSLVF